MLYDEAAVKANIRNREGKRVFFLGKGDQLTSAARDFLTRERIELRPGETAKTETYKVLGGGELREKPEHLTHLYGDVLVHKTHPRIAFRGAIDTLEAELLLAALAAPRWQQELKEILEQTRKLIRYDVLEQPVEEEALCGLTEGEIRKRSHFPQDFYAQPHFMPAVTDGAALLQLNRARCAARAAELSAVAAFSDREGIPTRTDIIKALNRMSSMLYLLMIQQKASCSGEAL